MGGRGGETKGQQYAQKGRRLRGLLKICSRCEDTATTLRFPAAVLRPPVMLCRCRRARCDVVEPRGYARATQGGSGGGEGQENGWCAG